VGDSIQYLLGKTSFMAWIFFEVNENVLIPRDRRISRVDFRKSKVKEKIKDPYS
jgi:methylase of polypeptide subunit release factors